MNDQEAEKFRQLLHTMLSDLEHQDRLGSESQRPVTLDQQSVGRLSRMDALQQQAMARATQGRRDQQKARITAALARLAEGEFGYCVSCGDEIAPERLGLDPTTPTCVTCARG